MRRHDRRGRPCLAGEAVAASAAAARAPAAVAQADRPTYKLCPGTSCRVGSQPRSYHSRAVGAAGQGATQRLAAFVQQPRLWPRLMSEDAGLGFGGRASTHRPRAVVLTESPCCVTATLASALSGGGLAAPLTRGLPYILFLDCHSLYFVK